MKLNLLKNTTVSVKTALTLLIVIMVFFLVMSTLFFAYQGNKYVTFKITEKLMYQIFSTTAQKLNFYFESSHQSLKDLSFTLTQRKFDLDNNPKEFLAYLEKLLVVNSSITGAYLGDERGHFYMAKRMPDGSISYRIIKRNEKHVNVVWHHVNPEYEKDFPSKNFTLEEGYDPRVRPWYIAAQKEKKGTVWTDPYIFASDRLLGISVASPITFGDIEGVFSVDFGLVEINDFLKNIAISKFSSLFLFDKRDRVMAYSSPYNSLNLMYKESGQSVEMLEVQDLNDPIIAGLYSAYKNRHFRSEGVISSSLYENHFFITILNIYIGLFLNQKEVLSEQVFLDSSAEENGKEYDNKTFYATYDISDESYLFMLNNFKVLGSFDTKLGIIIPQDAVISYFYYTYQIILFTTLGVVLVSLIIIIFIVNRGISVPILDLSKKMVRMVDEFYLDPVIEKKTKLNEILHIRKSLERVRKALVSFKKYLPKEVVANLIKSGKEAIIGGEKKEITIFFSDIKDFTKISEENPSDILFQKLEDYFTIVNNSISKHDGILDKYIGDAVMAMWGVPHSIPNHAASACLAAIDIKEKLNSLNKDFKDDDFPTFYIRIGIHTGIALVGNIGSEDRLNYTCVGDNVNLSSRLEELNKFYQTQILVSSITLQHAKEFVEYRMVDRVMVKGKTQRILIYEVISKKGELPIESMDFLKAYKEGIDFYNEGYWEDAIASFNNALKIKPQDFLTLKYLEKSKSFISKKINEIDPDEMFLNRRIFVN